MNNKSEINIKFVTVRCVNLTQIYCFLELGNTRPTREREREREHVTRKIGGLISLEPAGRQKTRKPMMTNDDKEVFAL